MRDAPDGLAIPICARCASLVTSALQAPLCRPPDPTVLFIPSTQASMLGGDRHRQHLLLLRATFPTVRVAEFTRTVSNPPPAELSASCPSSSSVRPLQATTRLHQHFLRPLGYQSSLIPSVPVGISDINCSERRSFLFDSVSVRDTSGSSARFQVFGERKREPMRACIVASKKATTVVVPPDIISWDLEVLRRGGRNLDEIFVGFCGSGRWRLIFGGFGWGGLGSSSGGVEAITGKASRSGARVGGRA